MFYLPFSLRQTKQHWNSSKTTQETENILHVHENKLTQMPIYEDSSDFSLMISKEALVFSWTLNSHLLYFSLEIFTLSIDIFRISFIPNSWGSVCMTLRDHKRIRPVYYLVFTPEDMVWLAVVVPLWPWSHLLICGAVMGLQQWQQPPQKNNNNYRSENMKSSSYWSSHKFWFKSLKKKKKQTI